MNNELEKTQLEIARLQLEQERLKLQKMQRRHEAKEILGQGAMAVGAAAAGGAGKAAGAVLGYVGRYLGWAFAMAVFVGAAYFLAVWQSPADMSIPQAIDYLLALPGAWGMFAILVAPIGIAAWPLASTEGSWAQFLVIVVGAIAAVLYSFFLVSQFH